MCVHKFILKKQEIEKEGQERIKLIKKCKCQITDYKDTLSQIT